ncbi:MAG: MFS transporter [Phycisphaerales bacterium]|jgi:MFS family permease|nr:MFS transporter [Phycisphaerales bacterium]
MDRKVEPEPLTGLSAERESGIQAKTGKLDRRYVTAALMLVMSLASMEQTVTSTAMPTIIGELHGLEHYSWVASLYLLAATVSMPLYGRLADALGRRRVILASILIFCSASLAAASAHSMMQLILFRGLQGLGAGGIMPVVLTILGDIFTLEERAKIQGLFSMIWGVAALAGPALGAFLVTAFGWRSIFFVNLPFGLLGLVVLMWKYHDHEKPHSTDMDWSGLISLALGGTALLVLVSRIGPDGWSWGMILALLALTIGSTIFFIRNEYKTANPIMPPDLMVQRLIGPSIIGSLLMGAGYLCLDTYVPLYVQGARGGGATAAAGVVTPVVLTWAISGFLSAPLLVRWGFRKVALGGSALIVIGFAGLVLGAWWGASHWVLTAVLSITGLGLGPCSMSYLIAAQESVEWQQRGIITSGISFMRTMGGALGIGVLGALFNALTMQKLEQFRAHGVDIARLLDPHADVRLPKEIVTDAQRIIGSGLLWVFVAMMVMALMQVGVTLLMSEHKTNRAISRQEAMEAMAG